jgi:hypothetical protein
VQQEILGLPTPLVDPSRVFIGRFAALITIGWPHSQARRNCTQFLLAHKETARSPTLTEIVRDGRVSCSYDTKKEPSSLMVRRVYR